MPERKGLNKEEYRELGEKLEECGVRICSVCGKAFSEGYLIRGGEYACSDSCRRELISDEDYRRAYYMIGDGDPMPPEAMLQEIEDDGLTSDETCWTDWENPLGLDLDALNEAAGKGLGAEDCMKACGMPDRSGMADDGYEISGIMNGEPVFRKK